MLDTPTTHILISDGFTQVLAILAEAYKCDSLSAEAAKFLMILLKGHKIVAMIDSKIL